LENIKIHESFESVSDTWKSILSQIPKHSIFQTIEWQKTWFSIFGENNILNILEISNNGEVIGIAPFLLSKDNKLTLIGSKDVYDYQDFLVIPNYEQEFFNEIGVYFESVNCTSIEINSIPENSATLSFMSKLAESNQWSFEQYLEDVCPLMELPEDWESYFSILNKKDRHELRRKFRRLDDQSEHTIQQFTTTEEITSSMDDFFVLMSKSGHHKAEFLTPVMKVYFEKLCVELSKENWTRLYFMEIDNKKVSACIAFDYNNIRYLYNSGFDPDYQHLSCGLLLNATSLKDSIEHNFEFFDFLRGDESYKYHLGAQDTTIYTIKLMKK
tara:strand:- start:1752 stop:2735 length:984 start_codon:yes stop_codon:yes gene_type:complete